jgi:hypothetical protein
MYPYVEFLMLYKKKIVQGDYYNLLTYDINIIKKKKKLVKKRVW